MDFFTYLLVIFLTIFNKGLTMGFLKVYDPLVGEISHQQQIRLFELVYQIKLNEERNCVVRFPTAAQHLSPSPFPRPFLVHRIGCTA